MLRMAIGAAAIFAVAALPSVASAESVVPPGNSAATQYTETFPTTGGNTEVNSSIGGGHLTKGGNRSPSKVLGSDTAEHLEEHGQEGRTVAELATESAPPGAGEGAKGGGSPGDGGGSGSNGSGGSVSDARVVGGTAVASDAAEGSSGLSEVFSHATGSSSGEMGIFLPLVLLAVPLCALAYAWRRRQPGRAAS